MRPNLRVVPFALLLPVLAAGAQAGSSGPRWSAWFGCWTPTDAAGAVLTICALPGGDAETVEIARVVDGRVVERRRIVADGVARPTADGCEGRESATFSADGKRVFIVGEMQCAGGPTQVLSGVMSISESGEWVEVRGTRVGDQREVRVVRAAGRAHLYQLPTEIRAALEPVVGGARAGRLGAGVPLTVDRVIEAADAVDERVVEAWLLASSLDADVARPATADDLVRMADGRVADRVIDAYVALGYPKYFAVEHSTLGDADERESMAVRSPDLYAYQPQCFYTFSYSCYVSGYVSQHEYFGYSRGWWGGYAGLGYAGRIIYVLPRDPSGGGRVVKGRGYVPRAPRSGTPATPRTNEGASNAGGGSGAAAPPAPAAPRTAKPRTP